jgi:hypothetical protein
MSTKSPDTVVAPSFVLRPKLCVTSLAASIQGQFQRKKYPETSKYTAQTLVALCGSHIIVKPCSEPFLDLMRSIGLVLLIEHAMWLLRCFNHSTLS